MDKPAKKPFHAPILSCKTFSDGCVSEKSFQKNYLSKIKGNGARKSRPGDAKLWRPQ